jgi:hypothetical protein
MAGKKFDGVVEAVRYKPDGQVDWVRAYLRRGPIFSDRVIINRSTLIEHLKLGKRYLSGKRIPFMASTFEVDKPLRLSLKDGREVLSTEGLQVDTDNLAGVPSI